MTTRGHGDTRLSLTAEGRETASRLAPLWSAIAGAVSGMLAEHAPSLPSDLDALERALEQRGLSERVSATLDLENLDDDSA